MAKTHTKGEVENFLPAHGASDTVKGAPLTREQGTMNPQTRNLGVTAFLIALLLESGGILAALALFGPASVPSSAEPAIRHSTSSPTPPTKKQRPEPPHDTRELITGYVAERRVVGKNEQLFWNVSEGTYAATLMLARDDERIAFVCVWEGNIPSEVQPGRKINVRGKYHTRTPGGARVYVECELVEPITP